jgi:sterol desaturase/sphingolipid hydroxylase (fatty acid hydroxylase superfamily)
MGLLFCTFGYAAVIINILAIPAALLYANFLEWALHKYILHGLGKKKDSFWAFHWHEHHKTCRKNKNIDSAYKQPLKHKSLWKEKLGLLALLLLHVPMLFILPAFFVTLVFCLHNYLKVHRKSHLDAEWAKDNVPWHYEHHMGKSQDANWGVTHDWFDRLFGTKK